MWRSRLFRKFFLIFASLIAFSSFLLISLFSARLETLVTEQVRERLQSVAVFAVEDARQFLPGPPSQSFREKIELVKEELDVRLRIYDTDKDLIGDSHEDPEEASELSSAAKNLLEVEGWDGSSDASAEFGNDLILYKLTVKRESSHLGYVLVSLQRSEFQQELATAERLVSTIVLTTSAIALLATYLLVSRIVQSLARLEAGTERLAEGNFEQEIDIETNDEFESLADRFNRMSHQLASRIQRLNEQKQEIQEGSERLRTVLGAMIEGVIAVDENQRILFANRAALNIFEISHRNYINRPLVEAVRHPGVIDVVEEVLHHRRLLTVEIEVPRKDMVLSVIASRLPGKPTSGVVMVFHDMTELRRLENLRREFVSNVSHELKTPLASIQAYTDTLLEGGLEDESINRKFLQRIEEQADRLHMLIVDVIKIAQVESGQEMFDMTAINLHVMVEECVQNHIAVAESKKIDLRVIPDANHSEVMVHADEEGLRTILDNLLDNALKYTLNNGKVTVEWTADDKRIMLSIGDTGVGIPREHLGRIFERFYRVDKARSREMGGTGLGLSIVKHLAQVFGGSISVESEQGVGTKFTVELMRA